MRDFFAGNCGCVIGPNKKTFQPYRGTKSFLSKWVGEKKGKPNLCNLCLHCDGEKQQVLHWIFFPSLFALLPALQGLIKYLTVSISKSEDNEPTKLLPSLAICNHFRWFWSKENEMINYDLLENFKVCQLSFFMNLCLLKNRIQFKINWTIFF